MVSNELCVGRFGIDVPKSGTKPANAESSGRETSIEWTAVRQVVNSGAIFLMNVASARNRAVSNSASEDQTSPHLVLHRTTGRQYSDGRSHNDVGYAAHKNEWRVAEIEQLTGRGIYILGSIFARIWRRTPQHLRSGHPISPNLEDRQKFFNICRKWMVNSGIGGRCTLSLERMPKQGGRR